MGAMVSPGQCGTSSAASSGIAASVSLLGLHGNAASLWSPNSQPKGFTDLFFFKQNSIYLNKESKVPSDQQDTTAVQDVLELRIIVDVQTQIFASLIRPTDCCCVDRGLTSSFMVYTEKLSPLSASPHTHRRLGYTDVGQL